MLGAYQTEVDEFCQIKPTKSILLHCFYVSPHAVQSNVFLFWWKHHFWVGNLLVVNYWWQMTSFNFHLCATSFTIIGDQNRVIQDVAMVDSNIGQQSTVVYVIRVKPRHGQILFAISKVLSVLQISCFTEGHICGLEFLIACGSAPLGKILLIKGWWRKL